MAEIRPLRAVRYEPSAVGSLDAVAAPPYDVIDDEMRAKLVWKSPFNVVEIDLPVADDGGDPYLHAQTTYEHWLQQGILVREREDSIWALTQRYEGPDGNAYTRHGFFARVRVEDYGPGGSARTSARTPARRRTASTSRARRARTCRRSSACSRTPRTPRGARSSRTRGESLSTRSATTTAPTTGSGGSPTRRRSRRSARSSPTRSS